MWDYLLAAWTLMVLFSCLVCFRQQRKTIAILTKQVVNLSFMRKFKTEPVHGRDH